MNEFFNGRDLTGWSGDPQLWQVNHGEIVGKSDGLQRNEFLISDFLAADFRLTLEVKLVGNLGNSGIQFRSRILDGGMVQGYQADAGPVGGVSSTRNTGAKSSGTKVVKNMSVTANGTSTRSKPRARELRPGLTTIYASTSKMATEHDVEFSRSNSIPVALPKCISEHGTHPSKVDSVPRVPK